jgi:hypothetical protein
MNLFLVKLYSLLSPLVAFANNHPNNAPDNPLPSGVTAENIQIQFTNPLGGGGGGIAGITSIQGLLLAILNIIVTVGIPLVVLAIIYSGFLFVTAMGDKEKIKNARGVFMWTIIGGIIILASTVIANAIDGTIQQIINS